jgi:hypothetical protein
VGFDERPRGSTWPTSKVHYNSLPRTSIEGALGRRLSMMAVRAASTHPRGIPASGTGTAIHTSRALGVRLAVSCILCHCVR